MFPNIFLKIKTICQYINVRIISFVSIIIFNFSFFTNLFADFYKFFKCRLFKKSSKTSAENICEEWEIVETNNWIRLLISMRRVNFFLNLFLNNLLVYFIIWVTCFVVVKKTILKTYPTKFMILNVGFALKLSNYTSVETFHISQINPKKSTILHTQFNYHTLPVSPFKFLIAYLL